MVSVYLYVYLTNLTNNETIIYQYIKNTFFYVFFKCFMFFLWIDPWVRKLWYAIIDENMNIQDAWILLQDTKKPTREDYFSKICQIKIFFEKLLKKYKIKACGIEKLFFTRFNQANAEFVYGERGVLITMLLEHDIKVLEYSPIELKKNISGTGKATKNMMQLMIQKIFNLTEFPDFDDAADAIGLAYLAKRWG